MEKILQEERFDFITSDQRAFFLTYNEEMQKLGYDFVSAIGSGYCWGKYMVIYRKSGVKSDKVYARIYLRDTSTVLRLFLNEIDEHRAFVEQAPAYIKEVFVSDYGKCQYCKNEKEGRCQFRKAYTIDNRFIEKCNGYTFEFHEPNIQKIDDYITLFTEFFHRNNQSHILKVWHNPAVGINVILTSD
jgi:hypothetical protein